MEHEHTNALINETSPYLLQHAHNPVKWYPWGEEALAKAQEEDKLILISVGYSACHWCHVMEHETFEDSAAAAFMNEHFISIKVDREERPDIDQIYMNAVQLMTQRGGWPLNCFALPDGRPVYGGTYFPKEKWLEVMQMLVDLRKNNPEQMITYAEQLTKGIQESELITPASSDALIDQELLHTLVDEWKPYLDYKEGGPNRSPKFPMPNNLEFLLHYGSQHNDEKLRDYVKTTLDKMAQGGIYDQIGGGFARYSTDGLWKVPHFEKMLYDNAQLVSLYCDGYRAFGEADYKVVVEQSLSFIERELTNENNLYYSALDADSEGEEGKFYIWTKEELELLLKDDFAFAKEYYNVNSKGKWEGDHYILLRRSSKTTFSEKNELTIEEIDQQITRINNTLMAARDERIRPGLDDKSLTSWNALMIKAYTDAFRCFGEKDWLNKATASAEALETHLLQKDGSLLHSFKDGTAKINGYLEDYCFAIEAYINLYQATFDERYLHTANNLASYAVDHFYDEERGMFWFTSDLDPELIARKQEVEDNVIPASNSSMAKGLFQLGTLFEIVEYKNISERMLLNVSSNWKYGQGYSNWGRLMLWKTDRYFEVAITGEDANELRAELDRIYLPDVLFMGGEKGDLPLLDGKFIGTSTIFVCENKSCQLPTESATDALSQMGR
ncbi:MAG: thioredoxin domain-containing protein [Flavobacteriales bacterium]|nr:thioredoxin domain-containing protein [Flavobacteriales bacterium]